MSLGPGSGGGVGKLRDRADHQHTRDYTLLDPHRWGERVKRGLQGLRYDRNLDGRRLGHGLNTDHCLLYIL